MLYAQERRHSWIVEVRRGWPLALDFIKQIKETDEFQCEVPFYVALLQYRLSQLFCSSDMADTLGRLGCHITLIGWLIDWLADCFFNVISQDLFLEGLSFKFCRLCEERVIGDRCPSIFFITFSVFFAHKKYEKFNFFTDVNSPLLLQSCCN